MSEKTYYMYKITNKLDGRIYIGQSTDPTARWYRHKYNAKKQNTNQYIHKAIHKHGVENFEFEIISEHKTKEEANQAEFDLIKKHNSQNKEFGYNLKPGGYKRGGWKHSEETKAKQKARWYEIHTPESIEKIAEANRGKKLSKEHVEAIRQANLGNKRLVSYKQPQSQIDKRMATIAEAYGSKVCNAPGCERTDGYKHKGVRYCAMHVQRIIKNGSLDKKSRKGIKLGPKSEETRRKLSEALKGRKVHNRYEFTDEQVKLIMSYTMSAEALAKKFNVSRNVIKRVRRENKL